MKSTKVLSAVCASTIAFGAAADEAHAFGDRVRATTASGSIVGTWIGEDQGAIQIETKTGQLMSVPFADLTKFEKSRRRSRGRGARIGLLAGAASGALIGFSVATSDPFLSDFDVGMAAAGAGAIVFGGAGALIGVLAPPGERWETISTDRFRVSVTPSRGRGVGIRVAIAF